MNIGRKILEARQKLNITQKELANMMGCSAAIICDYEKGKKFPKIENLKKLIEILKLDSSEFLGITVNVTDLTNDDIILSKIKSNKKIYDMILNNFEEVENILCK